LKIAKILTILDISSFPFNDQNQFPITLQFSETFVEYLWMS